MAIRSIQYTAHTHLTTTAQKKVRWINIYNPSWPAFPLSSSVTDMSIEYTHTQTFSFVQFKSVAPSSNLVQNHHAQCKLLRGLLNGNVWKRPCYSVIVHLKGWYSQCMNNELENMISIVPFLLPCRSVLIWFAHWLRAMHKFNNLFSCDCALLLALKSNYDL